ncbi:MAG: hypothetical protein JXA90_03105 [Planctomycetes bacterium]|nr:hypothetical protein [Planctomycetota bacterium]
MTLLLSIVVMVWIIADLVPPPPPWRMVLGLALVVLVLLGLLGVIHLPGRA